MRRVSFVRALARDIRLRHSHVTHRGRVKRFVIQLEVLLQGRWRPVARYDSAHGHPHVHRFRLQGRQRREPLAMGVAEALTLAQTEVERNWSLLVARHLLGGTA